MPLPGVTVRSLDVRQSLLEGCSSRGFEHQALLELHLMLGGGRDGGAELGFALPDVLRCRRGLCRPIPPGLVERGSGDGQLLFEALSGGVGLRHEVVVLFVTLVEVRCGVRQLHCVQFLAVLLRGFRRSELLLERRACGDFIREAFLEVRVALRRSCEFGIETLLGVFPVGQLLLERAAGRPRYGQLCAKLGFALAEVRCGGGGL